LTWREERSWTGRGRLQRSQSRKWGEKGEEESGRGAGRHEALEGRNGQESCPCNLRKKRMLDRCDGGPWMSVI